MKCDCRAIPVRENGETVDFDIEYCPLHHGAPEMLEVIKQQTTALLAIRIRLGQANTEREQIAVDELYRLIKRWSSTAHHISALAGVLPRIEGGPHCSGTQN